MATVLSASDFLQLSKDFPVIDVRSPAEFANGHIPGAINIPLFSDQARAAVGTSYKFHGRRAAILQGLDLVGPNLRALSEQMAYYARDNTLLIHCWRGGMRSQSMAWLASLNGYDIYILDGGYKAFRQTILDGFASPTNLVVLGGLSGSGKTAILHALARHGQQVIDLEGLAQHKGSAFGGIGQPPQPSQQHFENQLGTQWQALDRSRPVWIENENRQIGTLQLPEAIKAQIERAPILVLEVPFELRVERLVAEYGAYGSLGLEAAIRHISKRLGGLHTQQALDALRHGDLRTCCGLLLRHYYDNTYNRCLANKASEHIHHVRLDSLDAIENANTILRSGVLESMTAKISLV